MTPPDLSGTQWRTSSHSGHDGGECVELTNVAGLIGIRDSKDPTGPVLLFEPLDWARFVRQLKAGD